MIHDCRGCCVSRTHCPPPETRNAFALQRDPTPAEDFGSGCVIVAIPLLFDGANPVQTSLSTPGLVVQIDDAAREKIAERR